VQTDVPIVRIVASAAEADPANNVIAPIPGDRASCLAYIGGDESSLPDSFDAERGRGLHSFTFRLNVSAFCGIGGAFRGHSGGL